MYACMHVCGRSSATDVTCRIMLSSTLMTPRRLSCPRAPNSPVSCRTGGGACVHMYAHTHMYAYTHLRMHICRTHARMHTHTHAHTRTHTHKHMRTYMGAEDFVSEYSRTFKGEKGEAEAYCYFFKEEGNLASLRKVSRENTHTHKTKKSREPAKSK